MSRLTLKPNWMVTWITHDREPKATFHELASAAWGTWEDAKGNEIAIYRRREIKKGRGRDNYVFWELVDYHPASS